MSKLYFPQVRNYEVDENLIFISWPDHFQCFDYITGESQFKIDHGFWAHKIIDNKLFGQKDNGSDLLVYDLTGKLLKKLPGQFYFWMFTRGDQFLFFPGENEKEKKLGYKFDLATLTIAAELKHYNYASFVKGSVGVNSLTHFMYGYDIYTGENIWQHDFGEGIFPYPQRCYLNDDHLILSDDRQGLTCLQVESGKTIWKKENHPYDRCMHPVNKNLYGLNGDANLEIINSKTGDVILHKHFPELKMQFPKNTYFGGNSIFKDGLYFMSPSSYSKFGKLNIPGNDVAFVADLDIPKEPGLQTPSFAYNNCFFAFDFNQNLQVFRPLMK